jgi:hypothetical protein
VRAPARSRHSKIVCVTDSLKGMLSKGKRDETTTTTQKQEETSENDVALMWVQDNGKKALGRKCLSLQCNFEKVLDRWDFSSQRYLTSPISCSN